MNFVNQLVWLCTRLSPYVRIKTPPLQAQKSADIEASLDDADIDFGREGESCTDVLSVSRFLGGSGLGDHGAQKNFPVRFGYLRPGI